MLDAGDGGFGDSAIVVNVIGDIAAVLDGRAITALASFPFDLASLLMGCDSFGGGILFSEPAEWFLRPALGEVIVGGVVDFSDGKCEVVLRFKMLWHGQGIRILLPHGRFEVPAASRLRPQSGHETGAGGSANGDLAVGAFEKGAARGEGVDVWGVDGFVPVATELRAEVVDGDEEDVHPLCGNGTDK